MFRMSNATGCFVMDGCLPFRDAVITVRSEDSNGHKTISFAVDDKGIMILINLNPEVADQLKDVLGIPGRKKK